MSLPRSTPNKDYRDLWQISRGGSGVVTCAQKMGPMGFRQLVAIKSLQTDDPAQVEALQREARLGGLLRHQHLITVYELEHTGKTWQLVMEFVDGFTFRELIVAARQGRISIPPAVAFELVAQAATGLHYAHTAAGPDGQPLNLVHADIKPENLMLSRSGLTKVLDLGLAQIREAGRVVGRIRALTPAYAAPEQLAGREMSSGVDTHALGAVLFELLTLQSLRGSAAHSSEREATTLLREVLREGCRTAIPLLCRVLEPDVGTRLCDAGEMAAALRALGASPLRVSSFATEIAACMAGTANHPDMGGFPTLESKPRNDRWIIAVDGLPAKDPRLTRAGDLGAELLDVSPPRQLVAFGNEHEALQWLTSLLESPSCAVVAGVGVVTGDAAMTSGWGDVAALALHLVPELSPGVAIVIEPQDWTDQRRVGPEVPSVLRWERLGRFRFPGSGEALPLLEACVATNLDHPAIVVPGIYAGGGAPFRGLSAYTTADAEQFYGRDEEVQALRQALEHASLVTLTSASGGGKTSLIQAGLIPVMSNHVCHVIRPGPDPLLRLRTELGDASPDPQFQPDRWAQDLLDRTRQQKKDLLLVVDQAEELVTICVDPEARVAVSRALVALAEAGARVLLSVRADFFASLVTTGALRERAARKVIVLGPPEREACREAFLRPVKEFGYGVDDEILAELLDALPGEASALVLLQVCGERLWLGRDRQHRRLTVERFQQMGGLRGAIGEHADAVMAGLSPLEQRAARRLLNAMITEAGTRQPLTFIAASRLVGADAGARTLVDRLVRQRLLVSSDGVRGETMVDIIHDTLISDWSVLSRDREQAVETMRHLKDLHHAANAWEDRGRSTGMLWEQALFSWLKKVEDPDNLPLSLVESSFIQASQKQARWRRFRTSMVFVLTLLLFSTATYWFYEQHRLSQRAEQLEAERVTTREQLQAAGLQQALDRASREQARGNDFLAIQLAMSTFQQAPDNRDALRTLLSAIGPRQELAILAGHTKGVKGIEFSSDGRFILTVSSDGTARLWERSGRAIAVLCQQEAGTPSATFSPQGDVIATVTIGGLFQLWNLDGSLRTQTSLERATHQIAWNPTHPDRIAVADRGGAIQLITPEGRVLKRWQAHDPEKIREYQRMWVQWSPDGTLLASEGSDGFLHIWTLEGEPAGPAHGIDSIASGRWAADGQSLMLNTWQNGLWIWHRGSHTLESFPCVPQYYAIGSPRAGGGMARCSPDDNTDVLLTSSGGTVLHTLVEHTDTVRGMHWSPDGQRLVTHSINGEIMLWSSDGRLMFQAREHIQPVSAIAWAPDDEIFATGTGDATVRLWDGFGQPRRQVLLPAALRTMRWAPDGQHLFVASRGEPSIATALIASFQPGGTLTPIPLELPIFLAEWEPSGAGLATLDDQGTVTFWSASGVLQRRIEGRDLVDIRYHPIQPVLAALGRDGGVLLYDKAGPLIASDPGARAYLMEWSSSGRYLALGEEGAGVTIRSLPDLSIISRLDIRDTKVRDVCWHPGDDRLATVDESKQVAIWTATGEQVSSTVIPSSPRMDDCDWSSDGDHLATAGSDSRVRIWTKSGELTTVYTQRGTEIELVSWHPTLPQLLLFSSATPAEVIDVQGNLLAVLDSGPGVINQAAWSPQGNAIATGSDRETYVQIWPWGEKQLLDEAKRLLPQAN